MYRRSAVLALSVGLGLLGAAYGSIGSLASATTTRSATTTASKPAPGGRLTPATDTKTSASVSLAGAGANSINPFFEKVFYEYHLKNSKTTIT